MIDNLLGCPLENEIDVVKQTIQLHFSYTAIISIYLYPMKLWSDLKINRIYTVRHTIMNEEIDYKWTCDLWNIKNPIGSAMLDVYAVTNLS